MLIIIIIIIITIIIIIIIIFNEGTQFATAVFSVSPWQQPKVAKGELHGDDRL